MDFLSLNLLDFYNENLFNILDINIENVSFSKLY